MLLLMPQVECVKQVSDASLVPGAIKEHRPVLVLLDGSLPRNGVSPVVKAIKENGYQGRCLVLANDVQQQQEAESAGADVALVKGFPAARLLEIVKELMD
jgi:DNA-binding NarL/FixJ family response regulator